MKNLNKKIGAIALAGMVVFGGVAASGLRVHADEVVKISEKDKEKLESNIYSGSLPKDERYANSVGLKGLLNDDNDPKVQRQIQKIEDACRGSHLVILKASSEYSENGVKRGLDAFLEGVEDIVRGQKGGNRLFDEPELYFDKVRDFKLYLKEHNDEIESGFYKLQIGNVQVIFKARSGGVDVGSK